MWIFARTTVIILMRGEIMENNTLTNKKDTRNYGIDLLKIVSMIMIIVLHIIGNGSILKNTTAFSPQNNLLWFLKAACFCCVNCYALATGFLMYDKKVKYSNIIYLYLQVVFYMLFISVIYFIINPKLITIKNLIDIVFPFAHDGYWYFTAYFGMFFFIPYLNILIKNLNKRQFTQLLVVITVLFTVLPLAFDFDIFYLKSGYSVFWLIAMYLFGAYFKKYDLKNYFKKRTGLLIYILSSSAAFAIRMLLAFVKTKADWITVKGTFIINYCSPFVLMSSIGLLILFSNMHIKGRSTSIIKFFAPLTFGVYLIHVNPFLWESGEGLFEHLASRSIFVILLYIVVVTAAVFLSCSMIDYIRLLIFKSLKVKQASDKVVQYISKKVNKHN